MNPPLQGSLGGLSPRLRRAVEEHLARTRARGASPGEGELADPYWRRLPRWLAGPGTASGVLESVERGQLALFLAIRLRDDLFDRQATDRRLLWAADRLFLDAEVCFHEAVGSDERFWEHFRSTLGTTVEAIVEVDELQRRTDGGVEELLAAYALVDGIFAVGSAAVLAREDRWDDLSSVSDYVAGLAVAYQILDDLEDLGEDLSRDRRNAAARLLVANGERSADSVARALIRNGAGPVAAAAAEHLRRAADAAAALGVAAARDHVEAEARRLDELVDAVHRTRVGVVFRGVAS